MKKITLFLIVLLLNCCTTSKVDLNFKNYLNEIGVNPKIENGVYVLIPLNSCNSCIDKFITFFKKNELKPNKNVNIIIIDYSLKNINEFKKKLINYSIYADVKNLALKKEIIESQSSYVFEIENYKIIKKIEVRIDDTFNFAKEKISFYFE